METIKHEQILESWDIARLLDGWVSIPGYRHELRVGYKDMGDMLLVKTSKSRPSDGSFDEEMYSGVALDGEGRKAALLFSCQDKITEVMCLVLESTINSFEAPDTRQAELDHLTKSLKETFNHGRTVLHYAADQPHNRKHAEYVAELVLRNFEYGKELIKVADKYGRTALHYANLHGHIYLCTFLIKECGLKANEKDRNGENLLHFVVNSNQGDIVSSLGKKNEFQSVIASHNTKGKTPLHKAAANSNIEIIHFILGSMEEVKVEENICQPDLFGQTTLHEVVSGGHQEVVQYLLQKGSRPLFERNSEGKTALHNSVQLENQEVAKEMADILLNACSSDEEKLLLLWASATGMGTAEQSAESSPVVQSFLKQQKVNIEEGSIDLLLSVVKLGYDALAWELINRGANTSQLDNFSKGDLSQAHKQRIQKFLERVEKMPEGGRDQPTIHDSLGRRAFAEGLAALFLNPYVKSPVTVGISGDWGMGKSSLMLQTETILLQTAAQLAFPNILPFEDFPGCRQYELNPKGREKYNKVKIGMKDLLRASETDHIDEDPLVYFLDNYQDKYPQVYKSLALMDRGEMFRLKNKTSDSSSNLGKIPTILTVRYNAWHYQNELEAWAGLAVTITEAMEETMTKSQRIRSCWKYAWKERGGEIRFQFILPCLLAVFLSGWITWAVWMLLSRSKHSELKDLKYGSIPSTLLVIFWTVMRQLNSVFKPVSAQIMGYVRLPDHSRNLGYQHQVISDIAFLKKQICEKPSLFWKFLAGNWLWRMCGFYLDTVKGTSIPKLPPPSKDDIRIIVFVDDLDRCHDTVILQVLSAVNLVLAVCEINVILGMDKKMISRAIATKYHYQDNNERNIVDPVDLAEKYLSKIVQLPLALPDSGNDERIEFLNQQLGEEFKESRDDAASSSQPYIGAQPSDTESRPQSGTEIRPEPIPDAQPNDIENPPENLRQSSPQSRLEILTIIFQLLSYFRALRRRLFGRSYSGPDITSSKLKSTPINSQLILPSYSNEERKAIAFLSTQATDGPQIPRDWKRFLTYHRLAWNILFRIKELKNLPGWQIQLLVWIFCCWHWKDNINHIIKTWKELVSIKDGTVNDEDPSFKIIVEHCVDRIPDERKEKWQSLIQTLDKYDVSMEGIQSFQKFRLHCEVGYLPPPTNATEPMSSTSA